MKKNILSSQEQVYILIENKQSYNKLARSWINQLNGSYGKYLKKYGSLIGTEFYSDSLLVIHKVEAYQDFMANYESPFYVNKSLVVDLKNWETSILTYHNDSVRICRLVTIKAENVQNKFKKVASLQQSVVYPVMYLHRTVDYIVEIKRAGTKQAYHVCVEGLDRNHFEDDFKLKGDSEWSLIAKIFSESP